jgi:sec-independent protein translocase protein TatC
MSTTNMPAQPSQPAPLPPDPDDFFKDTRMSFGEHIEDLRNHLWRAVYGFLIALVVAMFLGSYVLDVITAPIKSQLTAYYRRQRDRTLTEQGNYQELTQPSQFRRYTFYKPQLAAMLKGQPIPDARPIVQTRAEWEKEKREAETGQPSGGVLGWLWDWLSWLMTGSSPEAERAAMTLDWKGDTEKILETDTDKHFVTLWVRVENPLAHMGDLSSSTLELLKIDNPTTLRAEEAFFVWFKVCMMTGLVLGSPWIFYQVWAFVAAGLYPHEKRLVHVYLPISLFLFLAGVILCEVFVIPKALSALLWFNEWLGFKPDIRLNEWLGFAIFMPLVFGLSFQTPLVMLFLNRLGICGVETFAGSRRMAWFLMAVFAAIITPSTDAFSMLLLWVPMSLLFELGIILIWMSPSRQEPEDTAEPGELVEV